LCFLRVEQSDCDVRSGAVWTAADLNLCMVTDCIVELRARVD
jgi:hypothetical protein